MAKYNGLQSFRRIWLRLYPFFCLDLFLCNFWWGHFVNLWPCYSCLSWMWKRVLIHFSCESSTSPSLQAYHKWFLIDVFYRMLSDLHLLAIFFMFLTKCNTSNWWFMPGSFSLMYLRIWVWRSVVICVGVIFSSLNICNVLINPFFSIWLELSTSETLIRDIVAILTNSFVHKWIR